MSSSVFARQVGTCRSHVFERFVRLDESRTAATGGAGLGLAIAHEIVHGHGGTIEVTDSPHGGALFVVAFPVGPAAD